MNVRYLLIQIITIYMKGKLDLNKVCFLINIILCCYNF